MADWDAAWRTWVDRVPQFGRYGSRSNGWAELIEQEGWVSASSHRDEDDDSGANFIRGLIHGHA